jgi:hypothetical protein
MDNGLIFPYPCERVHGEAGDTNRPKRVDRPSGCLHVERGI